MQKINVDLFLVDDKLLIPFESFVEAFKSKDSQPKINYPALINKKETEVISTPEIVNLTTELKVVDEPVLDNKDALTSTLSPATIGKLRINNNPKTKEAEILIDKLLEENPSFFSYITNTYYAIASKKSNNLICSYTTEPTKSKYLSVYIKTSLVEDCISVVSEESERPEYVLTLPPSHNFPIGRFTKTKFCVVYTQNNHQFYALIKKLIFLCS